MRLRYRGISFGSVCLDSNPSPRISASGMMPPPAALAMNYTYADLAKMIDHSLLNPTLAASDLEAGCKLALAYDAASVCIMPYYLRRCAEILRGSTVQASTTIGFPHGGHAAAIKLAEARQALAD